MTGFPDNMTSGLIFPMRLTLSFCLWQGQFFFLGFYMGVHGLVEDFGAHVNKYSYIGEQMNFFAYN